MPNLFNVNLNDDDLNKANQETEELKQDLEEIDGESYAINVDSDRLAEAIAQIRALKQELKDISTNIDININQSASQGQNTQGSDARQAKLEQETLSTLKALLTEQKSANDDLAKQIGALVNSSPSALFNLFKERVVNESFNFGGSLLREYTGITQAGLAKNLTKLTPGREPFIKDIKQVLDTIGKETGFTKELDTIKKIFVTDLADAAQATNSFSETLEKGQGVIFEAFNQFSQAVKKATNNFTENAADIITKTGVTQPQGTYTGRNFVRKALDIAEKPIVDRDRRIQEERIPEVVKRAKKLVTETTDQPTKLDARRIALAENAANAVQKETEELVIVIDGLTRSLNSGKLAAIEVNKQFKKNGDFGKKVAVGLENPDTFIGKDSDVNIVLAKNKLRGYSRDAEEVAAQAIAALEKNKDLMVTLVGNSLGGAVVEEAAAKLNKLGYGDRVKAIGAGTPDLRAKSNKVDNYAGYFGVNPTETLGAQIRDFDEAFDIRSKTKGRTNRQNMTVGSHTLNEYLKVPEIEKQVFGTSTNKLETATSAKRAKLRKEINEKLEKGLILDAIEQYDDFVNHFQMSLGQRQSLEGLRSKMERSLNNGSIKIIVGLKEKAENHVAIREDLISALVEGDSEYLDRVKTGLIKQRLDLKAIKAKNLALTNKQVSKNEQQIEELLSLFDKQETAVSKAADTSQSNVNPQTETKLNTSLQKQTVAPIKKAVAGLGQKIADELKNFYEGSGLRDLLVNELKANGINDIGAFGNAIAETFKEMLPHMKNDIHNARLFGEAFAETFTEMLPHVKADLMTVANFTEMLAKFANTKMLQLEAEAGDRLGIDIAAEKPQMRQAAKDNLIEAGKRLYQGAEKLEKGVLNLTPYGHLVKGVLQATAKNSPKLLASGAVGAIAGSQMLMNPEISSMLSMGGGHLAASQLDVITGGLLNTLKELPLVGGQVAKLLSAFEISVDAGIVALEAALASAGLLGKAEQEITKGLKQLHAAKKEQALIAGETAQTQKILVQNNVENAEQKAKEQVTEKYELAKQQKEIQQRFGSKGQFANALLNFEKGKNLNTKTITNLNQELPSELNEAKAYRDRYAAQQDPNYKQLIKSLDTFIKRSERYLVQNNIDRQIDVKGLVQSDLGKEATANIVGALAGAIGQQIGHDAGRIIAAYVGETITKVIINGGRIGKEELVQHTQGFLAGNMVASQMPMPTFGAAGASGAAIATKINKLMSAPKIDKQVAAASKALPTGYKLGSDMESTIRKTLGGFLSADVVAKVKIPEIKLGDDILPENSLGGYAAAKNELYLRKESFDQVKNGVVSEQTFNTLAHELAHAVQFGFGKLSDNRNKLKAGEDAKYNRLVDPATYTKEEKAHLETFLIAYKKVGASKQNLDYEADAEIAARRLSDQMKKMVSPQQQLQDQMDNMFGFGKKEASKQVDPTFSAVSNIVKQLADLAANAGDKGLAKAFNNNNAKATNTSELLSSSAVTAFSFVAEKGLKVLTEGNLLSGLFGKAVASMISKGLRVFTGQIAPILEKEFRLITKAASGYLNSRKSGGVDNQLDYQFSGKDAAEKGKDWLAATFQFLGQKTGKAFDNATGFADKAKESGSLGATAGLLGDSIKTFTGAWLKSWADTSAGLYAGMTDNPDTLKAYNAATLPLQKAAVTPISGGNYKKPLLNGLAAAEMGRSEIQFKNIFKNFYNSAIDVFKTNNRMLDDYEKALAIEVKNYGEGAVASIRAKIAVTANEDQYTEAERRVFRNKTTSDVVNNGFEGFEEATNGQGGNINQVTAALSTTAFGFQDIFAIASQLPLLLELTPILAGLSAVKRVMGDFNTTLREATLNYEKNLNKIASSDLSLSELKSSTKAFGAVATRKEQLSGAKQTRKELRSISDRTGADYSSLESGYAALSGASVGSNRPQRKVQDLDLAEGLTMAASANGLGTEQTGRLFTAFEQMAAKGVVSMEELRQQAAEALPQSLGLMADALEVTTGQLIEMMGKGQVMSEVALPKFAKKLKEVYGSKAALDDFKNSYTGVMQEMQNAQSRLMETIGNPNNGIIGAISKTMVKASAIAVNSVANLGAALNTAVLAGLVSVGSTIAIGLQIALKQPKIAMFGEKLKTVLIGGFGVASRVYAPFVMGMITDFTDDLVGTTKGAFENIGDSISNIMRLIGMAASPLTDFMNNLNKESKESGKAKEAATKRLAGLEGQETKYGTFSFQEASKPKQNVGIAESLLAGGANAIGLDWKAQELAANGLFKAIKLLVEVGALYIAQQQGMALMFAFLAPKTKDLASGLGDVGKALKNSVKSGDIWGSINTFSDMFTDENIAKRREEESKRQAAKAAKKAAKFAPVGSAVQDNLNSLNNTATQVQEVVKAVARKEQTTVPDPWTTDEGFIDFQRKASYSVPDPWDDTQDSKIVKEKEAVRSLSSLTGTVQSTNQALVKLNATVSAIDKISIKEQGAIAYKKLKTQEVGSLPIESSYALTSSLNTQAQAEFYKRQRRDILSREKLLRPEGSLLTPLSPATGMRNITASSVINGLPPLLPPAMSAAERGGSIVPFDIRNRGDLVHAPMTNVSQTIDVSTKKLNIFQKAFQGVGNTAQKVGAGIKSALSLSQAAQVSLFTGIGTIAMLALSYAKFDNENTKMTNKIKDDLESTAEAFAAHRQTIDTLFSDPVVLKIIADFTGAPTTPEQKETLAEEVARKRREGKDVSDLGIEQGGIAWSDKFLNTGVGQALFNPLTDYDIFGQRTRASAYKNDVVTSKTTAKEKAYMALAQSSSYATTPEQKAKLDEIARRTTTLINGNTGFGNRFDNLNKLSEKMETSKGRLAYNGFSIENGQFNYKPTAKQLNADTLIKKAVFDREQMGEAQRKLSAAKEQISLGNGDPKQLQELQEAFNAKSKDATDSFSAAQVAANEFESGFKAALDEITSIKKDLQDSILDPETKKRLIDLQYGEGTDLNKVELQAKQNPEIQKFLKTINSKDGVLNDQYTLNKAISQDAAKTTQEGIDATNTAARASIKPGTSLPGLQAIASGEAALTNTALKKTQLEAQLARLKDIDRIYSETKIDGVSQGDSEDANKNRQAIEQKQAELEQVKADALTQAFTQERNKIDRTRALVDLQKQVIDFERSKQDFALNQVKQDIDRDRQIQDMKNSLRDELIANLGKERSMQLAIFDAQMANRDSILNYSKKVMSREDQRFAANTRVSNGDTFADVRAAFATAFDEMEGNVQSEAALQKEQSELMQARLDLDNEINRSNLDRLRNLQDFSMAEMQYNIDRQRSLQDMAYQFNSLNNAIADQGTTMADLSKHTLTAGQSLIDSINQVAEGISGQATTSASSNGDSDIFGNSFDNALSKLLVGFESNRVACAKFVSELFNASGVSKSYSQSVESLSGLLQKEGWQVVKNQKDLKKGDAIFYKDTYKGLRGDDKDGELTHTGVALGGNKQADNSSAKVKVVIRDVDTAHFAYGLRKPTKPESGSFFNDLKQSFGTQNKGAIAAAMMIAAGEVGIPEANRAGYTVMGGEDNNMKGALQYNQAYFKKQTATKEGYLELAQKQLTGKSTVPTGARKYNANELETLVKSGQIKSGDQLLKHLQSKLTIDDWHGLHKSGGGDARIRKAGVHNQMFDYLKQGATTNASQPSIPTLSANAPAVSYDLSNTEAARRIKESQERQQALMAMQEKEVQKKANLQAYQSEKAIYKDFPGERTKKLLKDKQRELAQQQISDRTALQGYQNISLTGQEESKDPALAINQKFEQAQRDLKARVDKINDDIDETAYAAVQMFSGFSDQKIETALNDAQAKQTENLTTAQRAAIAKPIQEQNKAISDQVESLIKQGKLAEAQATAQKHLVEFLGLGADQASLITDNYSTLVQILSVFNTDKASVANLSAAIPGANAKENLLSQLRKTQEESQEKENYKLDRLEKAKANYSSLDPFANFRNTIDVEGYRKNISIDQAKRDNRILRETRKISPTEEMQRNLDAATDAQNAYNAALHDANPIASTLTESFKGLLSGTKSLGDAVMDIINKLADDVISSLSNQLSKSITSLFSDMFGGEHKGSSLDSFFSSSGGGLFSSILGGGGSDIASGFSIGADLGFDSGNLFTSLFANGYTPNYANGYGIAKALQKERVESRGQTPMLAVINKGESVLSTLNGDSEFYQSLKRSGDWDKLKSGSFPSMAIGSYSSGNVSNAISNSNQRSVTTNVVINQNNKYAISSNDTRKISESQLNQAQNAALNKAKR